MLHAHQHQFKACKERIPEFEFPGDAQTLRTQAIIIDEVSSVLSWDERERHILMEVREKDADQNIRHPSGLMFLNVMFRTWIAQIPGEMYGLQGFTDKTYGSKMYDMLIAFCSLALDNNYSDKIPILTDEYVNSFLRSFDWEGCPWNPDSVRSIEEKMRVTLGQGLSNYFQVCWKPKNGETPSYFSTRLHYIGVGPTRMENGDVLCVILGCSVPVVLRPCGGQYQFVGPCYVFGLMEGEAITDLESDGTSLKIESLKLV
jgi:hypothetical protein